MANGKIVVIEGPMFAGKTTLLINEMLKAQARNQRTILFKSPIDNRYSTSEKVISHDGLKLKASVLPEGEACLQTLKEAGREFDVIGIDEAHFWGDTKGFAQTLDDLAFSSKTIFVSLINRKGNGGAAFEIAKELVPLADEVLHLDAKCAKCGEPAAFSQMLIDDKGSKFFVGGAESYEPRCRLHFEK